MNTERLHTVRRTLGKLLLLPVAGIVLAACGVTEPDEAAWQSAASYSWPVGAGKRELSFRNELSGDHGLVPVDTSVFVMEAEAMTEQMFAGQLMYKLDQQHRSRNFYFLPMQDTLIIFDQLPATVALTTPLEKGHEWICEFADSIPSWKATIVERYSYRNVQGTIYRNVIEVKYEPLTPSEIDEGHSWVRFFAKGVGPVQTIKLLNTFSSDPSLPDKSVPVERMTLIHNIEVTN